MMAIISAFRHGVRRVNGAPLVLAGMFLVTFLVALPLGLVVQRALAQSLGASNAAGIATGGANYAWWREFSSQASGIGRTFSPSIIGAAAVLDNVSGIVDNRSQGLVVACAGAVYIFAWLFLAGGIVDRYARSRRIGTAAFFAACGTWFFRFVRLGLVALLVYFALFAWLHAWLFGGLYARLTRDLTVEWHAVAIRLGLYGVFGALLCLCNLLFDYARVRAVVEDRRSMAGALFAAIRFARARPDALGLYLLDGCCFLLVALIYVAVAPGARVPVWWTVVVGQAYVLARIWIKLLFYASEVAFFQHAFAHAGYVAVPPPAWPESPAAEGITRA